MKQTIATLALVVAAFAAAGPVSAAEGTPAVTPRFSCSSPCLNGLSLNGLTLNGMRLNGPYLQGVELNGYRWNGAVLQGVRLNGFRWNGVVLQGVRQNGFKWNGALCQVPGVGAVAGSALPPATDWSAVPLAAVTVRLPYEL